MIAAPLKGWAAIIIAHPFNREAVFLNLQRLEKSSPPSEGPGEAKVHHNMKKRRSGLNPFLKGLGEDRCGVSFWDEMSC